MTCQKCGKNNRSSHKCRDDVVYGPETDEENKISEVEKLLQIFEKLLNEQPYLAFEIGYTRTTDWMVHVWDYKGRSISESEKIIETQSYDREEACKLAREQLERYL